MFNYGLNVFASPPVPVILELKIGHQDVKRQSKPKYMNRLVKLSVTPSTHAP